MHSFYSLRLSSHTLLCSTLICMIPCFQQDWIVFALIPVLTLLASLAATNCAKPAGRLFLGLIPALVLLLPVADMFTRIAAGAVVLYVAVSLTAARFKMEVWRYKPEVIVLSCVLAGVILIALMIFGTYKNYRYSILFAASAILLSLMALRALRLGRAPSGKWQLWCAGLFVLPLLGGTGAAGVFLLIMPVLGKLLSALSFLPLGVMYLYTTTLDAASNAFYAKSSTLPSIEKMTGYTLPEEYVAPTNEVIGHIRTWQQRVTWGPLLALACGFALILLVFWLILRNASSAERKKPEGKLIEEKHVKEKALRRTRKKRGSTMTNRDQIRIIYQSYLSFLSQNGVHLERCDTTADISKASSAILKESDEVLRRLYRKARYSSVGFTDEDVKAASEAFERLTREENLIQQGKAHSG